MNGNGEIVDLQKFMKQFSPKGKGIFFIAGAILAFLLLVKSVVVIPAGHVGIKDLFGNVSDEAISPGIHIVNPLMQIHKMSIRTQELTEEAHVPSKEGLTVNLDVSLLFSLNPAKAAQVYKTLGPNFIGIIVVPQLRSVVRGATASYEAKALYTAEREMISNQMFEHLKPVLEERGIIVEKILLRAVKLPEILSTAIEMKLQAEQQSEQMKFVLQKEEQEADRKRVEAKGIADFQKIVTSGLTPHFLTWKGIEATAKLADSQNSKVVVIGNSKDGLPIILGGENK